MLVPEVVFLTDFLVDFVFLLADDLLLDAEVVAFLLDVETVDLLLDDALLFAFVPLFGSARQCDLVFTPFLFVEPLRHVQLELLLHALADIPLHWLAA